jgi:hypothetical protein
MEVDLPPDQLDEELARVRSTLASRYDELKSGAVPISGDEVITRMRNKSAARRTSNS